jgi:hypothetical protein
VQEEEEAESSCAVETKLAGFGAGYEQVKRLCARRERFARTAADWSTSWSRVCVLRGKETGREQAYNEGGHPPASKRWPKKRVDQ